MGILVNANELLQKKGESMNTDWEWPPQAKRGIKKCQKVNVYTKLSIWKMATDLVIEMRIYYIVQIATEILIFGILSANIK